MRSQRIDGIDLVGVVDPALSGESWRGVPVFSSARSAQRVTGAEAAILATPATCGRYKQASRLVDDGYALLRIEKPVALSSREAKKLLALEASSGVEVYAGHQTLAAPEARAFRMVVAAESIVSWTSVRTTRHASPDPVWDLAIHDAAQYAAADVRCSVVFAPADRAATNARSTVAVTADGGVIRLDELARTLEYPGGYAAYEDAIDPLGACLESWRDHGRNLEYAVDACRILSRRGAR